jgi:hypothetical protein
MNVRYTNDKNYPIEISDTYSTVAIHKFDLMDDDSWNEFINQLNFFRDHYMDGSLAQLQENIKKSRKKINFL